MWAWICSVDWSKAIGVAKDVVLAVSAAITAAAAVRGISKWRAEEQGKADSDLARRALLALFQFQTSFQRARWVATTGSEYPRDFDPIAATAEQKAEAWTHIFTKRLDGVHTSFVQVEAILVEMEALWGSESRSGLDGLYGCYSRLRGSMELYVKDLQSGGAIFGRSRELGSRVESDVFDAPLIAEEEGATPPSNELTDQLKEVVSAGATQLRMRLPMHRR
jgi:hypothetical protein